MKDIVFKELKTAHEEVQGIKDAVLLEKGTLKQLETMKTIIQCSKLARNEGLLALEQESKNMPESKQNIKDLLMSVVDGVDPSIIETGAIYRAATLLLHDFNSIIYWMEVVGVLLIQEGEHHITIKRILLSMMTEDAIKTFNINDTNNNYMNQYADIPLK